MSYAPPVTGASSHRGALLDAYQRARESCPGVELPFEAMVEAADAMDSEESRSTAHWEDVFLALACARGDHAAVQRVERSIERTAAAIGRVDPRPEFVEEVMQRVRVRLLCGDPPRIGDYRGRGPLTAFISVAATRTALNLRRDEAGTLTGIDDAWASMLSIADTCDVELEALKDRHRADFSNALRAACEDLSERERTILRLYFFDEQGIDRLAERFGVHRSTAARWVQRAKTSLHDLARVRLKASTRLGSRDASLIEKLLLSQLSVSFSGLREQQPSSADAEPPEMS